MESKKCTACGEEKPTSEYVNRENGKKRAKCKSCINEYRRKHYAENREHFRAKAREQYKKEGTQKTLKEYRLKSKYGIGTEDVKQMHEDQDGRCAICETEKDLVVDHCHTSGEVRSLLCHNCNSAIGLMYEDKEILANAIKYLEMWTAPQS